MAMGYRLDGCSLIHSRGQEIFLYSTASKPALRALSLGGEADHSPPFSAEFKTGGAIPPLPGNVFMAWCLIQHRDNFILAFTSSI